MCYCVFQLLDLMHTLHTKAAAIFTGCVQEAEAARAAADSASHSSLTTEEIDAGTSALWITCWCPLLQGHAHVSSLIFVPHYLNPLIIWHLAFGKSFIVVEIYLYDFQQMRLSKLLDDWLIGWVGEDMFSLNMMAQKLQNAGGVQYDDGTHMYLCLFFISILSIHSDIKSHF